MAFYQTDLYCELRSIAHHLTNARTSRVRRWDKATIIDRIGQCKRWHNKFTELSSADQAQLYQESLSSMNRPWWPSLADLTQSQRVLHRTLLTNVYLPEDCYQWLLHGETAEGFVGRSSDEVVDELTLKELVELTQQSALVELCQDIKRVLDDKALVDTVKSPPLLLSEQAEWEISCTASEGTASLLRAQFENIIHTWWHSKCDTSESDEHCRQSLDCLRVRLERIADPEGLKVWVLMVLAAVPCTREKPSLSTNQTSSTNLGDFVALLGRVYRHQQPTSDELASLWTRYLLALYFPSPRPLCPTFHTTWAEATPGLLGWVSSHNAEFGVHYIDWLGHVLLHQCGPTHDRAGYEYWKLLQRALQTALVSSTKETYQVISALVAPVNLVRQGLQTTSALPSGNHRNMQKDLQVLDEFHKGLQSLLCESDDIKKECK
ncbi:hypothetical protein IWQ62_001634 [Dispira parvispora]|uniref:Uncharacterized protein n=1 Tax=Dispira parvispora TaxID=1520584 RepID=A0A9W8AS35_9FUNG|nr:hypothetical protein IWQ62_001634 [Dispira parvispora]